MTARKEELSVEFFPESNRINYRTGLNQPMIVTWSEQIKEEGYVFPPIQVVYDIEIETDTYYLWDGNHRIEANIMAGRKTIPAFVRDGTREDAEWFALTESNLQQRDSSSIPLRNEDKVKYARESLLHPKTEDFKLSELPKVLTLSLRTINRAKKDLGIAGKLTSAERKEMALRKSIATKLVQNPEISQRQLAEELGVSRQNVSQCASLAQAYQEVMEALVSEILGTDDPTLWANRAQLALNAITPDSRE